MDGMGWLIKNALAGAGVEIDPKEIVGVIETAKVLIPKIASEFESQRKTLARLELKLDSLITLQKDTRLTNAKNGIDSQLEKTEMYQR